MDHKEMTVHIRKRLKIAKVNARVKMNDFCGHKMISVVTPSYEYRWSDEERAQIKLIAEVNCLTLIRGMEIREILANEIQINFEFHR